MTSGHNEMGSPGDALRYARASRRRYLTGLAHQLLLTSLAATFGVMSVLMLGLHEAQT